MSKRQEQEKPVNAQQAAAALGCGVTRISGIKKSMGLSYVRFILLSDIAKFLAKNPHWKEATVYKRKPLSLRRSGSRPGLRNSTADTPDEPPARHDLQIA